MKLCKNYDIELCFFCNNSKLEKECLIEYWKNKLLINHNAEIKAALGYSEFSNRYFLIALKCFPDFYNKWEKLHLLK